MFSVVVKGAVSGSYTNTTGMVTFNNGGTGNAASASITVQPQLQVSQTIVPSAIYRGSTYAYAIAVSNLGSAAVSGVTIRDVLPTNAIFLGSLPFGYSVSANVLTINVGTVAGHSSKTILIWMYVPFTTAIGGTITNSISVRTAGSGVVDLCSSMYSLIVAQPKPANFWWMWGR